MQPPKPPAHLPLPHCPSPTLLWLKNMQGNAQLCSSAISCKSPIAGRRNTQKKTNREREWVMGRARARGSCRCNTHGNTPNCSFWLAFKLRNCKGDTSGNKPSVLLQLSLLLLPLPLHTLRIRNAVALGPSNKLQLRLSEVCAKGH